MQFEQQHYVLTVIFLCLCCRKPIGPHFNTIILLSYATRNNKKKKEKRCFV
jgi:hypothetical protein